MHAPLPASPSQIVPDTSAEVEVSVVMPCLNEARTVGRCIDKALGAFQAMGVHGEVVVADNGSTDGSPAIAREHGAKVVAVARRGYGNALQAGIAAASGQYVIMGDADDSYDFSQLHAFVDRLRAGHDLVMGNRFQGGIRPGAMPWLHRYIGNPVLTGILNLFYHSPIHDAHCGLRGFRKDSYQRLGLKTEGMEFASEMVVKACLNHQRMTEVPIVLYPDGRDRPPHLRSFRDGWRHLRFLLLLCPLWLYLIPASFLLILGTFLMVWLTPGQRLIGHVEFDMHTMLLGSLCVMLGYQTLWFWAFARLYGWRQGLLPRRSLSASIFDSLNVEGGLALGTLILLAGIGVNLWLLHEWYASSFGPLLDVRTTMRWALWGLTMMMVGAQTIYGSFFLGMLGMAGQDKWENTTAP